MRTTKKLMCKCGREGLLHCDENDRPFSPPSERYSIEGFIAENWVKASLRELHSDALDVMMPKCPSCGEKNKVAYA